MKLSELSKKPKPIKVELADENIVSRYGEPIEFYMYDRYEMDVYMKLLNAEESDIVALTNIIKKMIVNEDETPVINDGEIVPSDVLIKIVEEVAKRLGNSMTQTLET